MKTKTHAKILNLGLLRKLDAYWRAANYLSEDRRDGFRAMANTGDTRIKRVFRVRHGGEEIETCLSHRALYELKPR